MSLRFLMDESSMPYEQGECPCQRTTEDDAFDKRIIEKYNLVTPDPELLEMEKIIYFTVRNNRRIASLHDFLK